MEHHIRRVAKRQGSVLLVLVLMALLVLWWALAAVVQKANNEHIAPAQAVQELVVDQKYVAPKTLPVTHTTNKGTDSYSGELVLSNCDTFSTNLSVAGTNPAAISLAFTVAKLDPACNDAGTSTDPFLVSYTGGKASSTLAHVVINNQPVSVSLVRSSNTNPHKK